MAFSLFLADIGYKGVFWQRRIGNTMFGKVNIMFYRPFTYRLNYDIIGAN